ncbi:MAG: 50S ribosomal protein L21, partial [Candidatus Dormibacteraeota bacterium]|nr:50S ribosomal protein L21 [Candidatus Dormibacteraeota bacterium]
MPAAKGAATAVVMSGGKQYRVAAGDRILVDRIAADTDSELTFERVLLVADGDTLLARPKELAGQVVTGRVISHPRGKKIDVLRYKSKKRVRVHRGARADLTAVEILSIGKPAKGEMSTKGEPKMDVPEAKAESKPRSTKPRARAAR